MKKFFAGLFVFMATSLALATPAITSLTPNTGLTSGGTTVVIAGTGLGSASACYFGGARGTIIGNIATAVTVVSPAHGAGVFPVYVQVSGNNSNGLPFTYVAPTATNTPTSTCTNTPTDTPTYTKTITPTDTRTNTPVFTPTNTPSNTSTNTITQTFTITQTPTKTCTNTPTNTGTLPATSTPTSTITDTPTVTLTYTVTSTNTITSTFTKTPTAVPTSTNTPIGILAHITNIERVFQPSDNVYNAAAAVTLSTTPVILSTPGPGPYILEPEYQVYNDGVSIGHITVNVGGNFETYPVIPGAPPHWSNLTAPVTGAAVTIVSDGAAGSTLVIGSLRIRER